jgi:hypothetical protein
MRDMLSRLGVWGELLGFLWRRKLYWMLPLIIALTLIVVFVLLASNPITAPFVYPVH